MPLDVWPESKIEVPQKEVERSERKTRCVGVLHECEVLLGWKGYSSVAKMRRVVAYLKRFLSKRANKERRASDWSAYSTGVEICSEFVLVRRCSSERRVERSVSGADSSLLTRDLKIDI